jgi:hypothetical protein
MRAINGNLGGSNLSLIIDRWPLRIPQQCLRLPPHFFSFHSRYFSSAALTRVPVLSHRPMWLKVPIRMSDPV